MTKSFYCAAMLCAAGLAGCDMTEYRTAHPNTSTMAYNEGYYPQQAPFYAGASAPVTQTARDNAPQPAVTHRIIGCRRHPHYHSNHEIVSGTYATPGAVTPTYYPVHYPVLFTYPTATHGYDWNYWRSRRSTL